MADQESKQLLRENIGALNQILAQQQQTAEASRPTGIFANVDPVMLGLAQGLLSPTRTGGFGESLGLGLAGAQAPLEAMRRRQMDAQDKILQTRLAAARMAVDMARADRYGSGDSLAQERLRLADQLKMIGEDFDPDAENPYTGQKFANEQEWRNIKRDLTRRYFSLGSGAPPPVSTTETTTQEQPAQPEKPPEKGILQKTKEFLGIGGDEAKAAPAETKKTPPKDYPDARIGTNPNTGKQGWFVVRDGKTYEVQ